MKFIHLSDLHIGKRINNVSMLENGDQQAVLEEILRIINDEKPDAVLIAGDVYDRSTPPLDAVTYFDDFLYELSKGSFHTFIISGNHDSPERLSFGRRIMENKGVHISPVFGNDLSPVVLFDEFGEVNIYMLPFIRPYFVKAAFPELKDSIESYTDAVKAAVDAMHVDNSKRNVILSHQFVTGATLSGSEISVGDTENVDVSAYEPFDYVALGHIHSAQKIGGFEHIRYCGSPLKYSFGDNTNKSVTVVELREKGCIEVKSVSLVPQKDMRTIRNSFEKICENAKDDLHKNDYIRIVLTDKFETDNALGKLRKLYPNIMELSYEQSGEYYSSSSILERDVENRTPIDLITDFYRSRQIELDSIDTDIINSILHEMEEENYASD